MNADKIKKPLLLIHGEADNNTGARGRGRGKSARPQPGARCPLLSQPPSCLLPARPTGHASLPPAPRSPRTHAAAGTYPMQSERFYQALKGHGGTTRLVLLPHESHGYSAR